MDRCSRVELRTITSCQNLGFRVFFYDNYYYTVAVFFISARIRITVLIETGTLIHLVTMRILIRI